MRPLARVAVGGALSSVALVVVVVATRGGRPSGGEGQLYPHGQVLVVSSSGSRTLARHSVSLHRGDTVTVVAGSADVHLGSGSLGMRSGTVVHFDHGPILSTGELLADGSAHPVLVSSPTGDALVAGVARIQRNLVFTAATYRGTSRLETAGLTLTVPALRQGTITADGILAGPVIPLVLHEQDPWDRQYLGDAITLTDQLDSLSLGFTASIPPGQSVGISLYRQALEPLASQPAFNAQLLAETVPSTPLGPVATPMLASASTGPSVPATSVSTESIGVRPAGDVLVGASIAITSTTRGSFARHWQAVFAFRDAGAAWGLVALDQRASSGSLLGLVHDAIDRSPSIFSSTPVLAAGPAFVPASPLPVLAAVGPSPSGTVQSHPVIPSAPGPVPTVPGVTLPTVPAVPPPTAPPAPPVLAQTAKTVTSTVSTVSGVLQPVIEPVTRAVAGLLATALRLL